MEGKLLVGALELLMKKKKKRKRKGRKENEKGKRILLQEFGTKF